MTNELNEEVNEEVPFCCEECDDVLNCEDDVFPYEDMKVCEDCFDELRIRDEQEVQDWETEGYDYNE